MQVHKKTVDETKPVEQQAQQKQETPTTRDAKKAANQHLQVVKKGARDATPHQPTFIQQVLHLQLSLKSCR